MDGRMDGRTDGWMDGKMKLRYHYFPFKGHSLMAAFNAVISGRCVTSM